MNAQDFTEVQFHSEFEQAYFNQSNDYLARLLMSDASVTSNEYFAFKKELDEYLTTLKTKRDKIQKNKDFVSHIFYKTHRKFLKRYTPFSSVVSVWNSGKYDCLSATSLYSYLFRELNIAHDIIETSYHIYINVQIEEGNILIESTDPIYGFVDDPAEINQRLSVINSEASFAKDTYTFTAHVNETITSNELIGLQYYNQAVAAFNVQEYEMAINLLSKGLIYRKHARTIEFGLVVAQSIMKDLQLKQNEKLTYVSKLQRLLHKNEALATR